MESRFLGSAFSVRRLGPVRGCYRLGGPWDNGGEEVERPGSPSRGSRCDGPGQSATYSWAVARSYRREVEARRPRPQLIRHVVSDSTADRQPEGLQPIAHCDGDHGRGEERCVGHWIGSRVLLAGLGEFPPVTLSDPPPVLQRTAAVSHSQAGLWRPRAVWRPHREMAVQA